MPNVSVDNFLVNVATWVKSELGLLHNHNAAIANFNREFDNPQNYPANLGDSLNIQLPPRLTSGNGLKVNFQSIKQRLHPLVVDQAKHVAYSANAQQYLFNLSKDSYLKQVAKPAMAKLGADVESYLFSHANSSAPVMTLENNQTVPTGALRVESGPFRCFGDGRTAVDSFTKLAQMIERYKDFGSASGKIDIYLPLTAVSTIIGSGLSQFSPKRADETSQSWKIGSYGGTPEAEYYNSNLLPIQVAGSVGKANSVLTVVSTVLDSTGAIVAIECSGAPAANDPHALHSGDILTFKDGVSGHNNMRFLGWSSYKVTDQPVQIRVTSDVTSTGASNVTIPIYPGLQAAIGSEQNINQQIQVGMQLTSTGDHRVGLVVGGNAAYFSSPKLPETTPYPSVTERDEETGLSMRMYYGAVPFENFSGYVHDLIFTGTILPEYTMRIAFPLTVY